MLGRVQLLKMRRNTKNMKNIFLTLKIYLPPSDINTEVRKA